MFGPRPRPSRSRPRPTSGGLSPHARWRRVEFLLDLARLAHAGHRVGRHVSDDRIGESCAWYHRNETSPAFASTLKVQSLESVADKAHDPLLHRTFGGYMTGAGFRSTSGHSLTVGFARDCIFLFANCGLCSQTEDARHSGSTNPKRILSLLERSVRRPRSARPPGWHAFWDRSWVIVDGDQRRRRARRRASPADRLRFRGRQQVSGQDRERERL